MYIHPIFRGRWQSIHDRTSHIAPSTCFSISYSASGFFFIRYCWHTIVTCILLSFGYRLESWLPQQTKIKTGKLESIYLHKTQCTLGVIQIAVIYYRGSNFNERRMPPDTKFLSELASIILDWAVCPCVYARVSEILSSHFWEILYEKRCS